MTIDPPKTLEEFKAIEKTTITLINNPWADALMRQSLELKLEKCQEKIKELETK